MKSKSLCFWVRGFDFFFGLLYGECDFIPEFTFVIVVCFLKKFLRRTLWKVERWSVDEGEIYIK